ncbi:pH-response regulator protein palC [Phyllosticta citrichinensis]|uniref:pH-response regulator protein palC n=1 Tax=Phyllosticta citrichinensis TaxID=1130410 RepID=A0ABR1Y391_9PEZI
MPFPFQLPTTGALSFADYFSSNSHPSLPLAATTCRGVLRDVLKRHKRLPPSSQAANLPTVLSALNEYIPYLSVLDAGLSGKSIGGEEVDVVLVKEPQVDWRATLTATLPGRDPPRVKLQSLEAEIFFVLSTLAYVHSLLARAQLHSLQSSAALPTPEQRTAAISSAMRSFLDAHSIHAYLVQRSGQWTSPAAVGDISAPVLNALAELSLAEATLIAVSKDDPYPAVVAEDRNKQSKDWMFKAPDIPKVRAHLFARLCLAAAEHAARGQATVGGASKVDEALARYLGDLKMTARGKACRFFGIDAELSAKTGEGIAWLRGARKELGFLGATGDDEKKARSFTAKLKKDWAEKREDKRIEKGVDWGTDAGRLEEGRVVEMLEKKWVKMNDTVGMDAIPPFEPLLATMPSGREYHTPKPFKLPCLDETIVTRMRAPPDPSDSAFAGEEDDSGVDDDNGNDTNNNDDPIGAFPGTRSDYAGSSNYF